MPLKTILDKLDGVEDALHGLYEEKDGKFVLQLEGIDDHPAVVALKNGHANSKRERDQARKDLQAATSRLALIPQDFDAGEWERLRTEDEARKADPEGKDVRKQIEAAVAAKDKQWETKHNAALRAKDEQIAERDQTISSQDKDLRTTLVHEGLTKELIKAGVKPTLLKAAMSMFEHDVEVVVEDGKRVAKMKSDLGGDELGKYIGNWAQSDDAKDFIAPAKGGDEKGGGGGLRNGEVNPWKSDSLNLTTQMQIIRQDRAKAERMMKQANLSQQQISSYLGA